MKSSSLVIQSLVVPSSIHHDAGPSPEPAAQRKLERQTQPRSDFSPFSGGREGDNKLATALRMESKYAGSEPTITYTKAYPTEIVTSRQSLQLYIHTQMHAKEIPREGVMKTIFPHCNK